MPIYNVHRLHRLSGAWNDHTAEVLHNRKLSLSKWDPCGDNGLLYTICALLPCLAFHQIEAAHIRFISRFAHNSSAIILVLVDPLHSYSLG